MDSNVAENINILAKFLGTRDIDALNQEELLVELKTSLRKNILLLVEQDIQQIHYVRLFI